LNTYVGTNIVSALPMNRADYNTLRGWTLPVDENGADEGYLVEDVNNSKPNHPDYKGYVSWSPTEQFERIYIELCPENSSDFLGASLIKLTAVIKSDMGYAWGWHCNIAMAAFDAGCPHDVANEGAARFMKLLFGVDTRMTPWFPATQKAKAMTFGSAIEALRGGLKVARAGWNGKGMWLILVPGTKVVNFTEGSPYMKAGLTSGEILPHIDMYTTNAEGRRAMLPGWVASQTDMLALDWVVVS
jgi:hypothetical protein